MSVEFYKDIGSEHRWRVTDGEHQGADILHGCHEGFSSKGGALHNLFVNHMFMNIFVQSAAGGMEVSTDGDSGVWFEEGKDQKIRWKIKSGNGEIVGQSHQGFATEAAATDNLIIIYTMLTMFVAEVAQAKRSDRP